MNKNSISTLFFVSIIILVGLVNFIVNYDKFLVNTNKEPLIVQLTSGQLFSTIENNYNSNFIFKESFVNLKNFISSYKGVAKQNQIIDSKNINVANDWKSETTDIESELLNNTEFGSILIVDNKAMEINIQNDKAIELYAETLNKIEGKLNDSVNIYSMIVPTQIEFCESEMDKKISYSELSAINNLYSLYINIKGINVYNALEEHSDE